MTKTIGIIPAGGKADRFNGSFKELLPLHHGGCGLERAIRTMQDVGAEPVVLSTPIKASLHAQFLSHGAHLLVGDWPSLWLAIWEVCDLFDADRYYFVMPDTIFARHLDVMPDANFGLGVFETTRPNRFGVILKGQIVDKPKTLNGRQAAWGTAMWTRRVVDSWRIERQRIATHTQAFNLAMSQFDWRYSVMAFYYDLASMQDYAAYIQNEKVIWNV